MHYKDMKNRSQFIFPGKERELHAERPNFIAGKKEGLLRIAQQSLNLSTYFQRKSIKRPFCFSQSASQCLPPCWQ